VSVLLEVADLRKWFPVRRGLFIERTVDYVKAVDDVSFEINEGETLGLVGESGSGKSTTGYSVLQLLKPTGGSVQFMGKELTTMSRNDLREIRREMQIVFQDPYSSLNPRMTVGNIVAEPLTVHGVGTRRSREASVRDLLETVGFNPDFTNRYPHEFSGGQRQRIGIARALALNPRLIVCDEPVSALDVSIQAQILNLLEDLQEEFNLTYLFIAHDLSVVKHVSDRVAVMYLGRIVEMATGDTLYENPKHPYSGALLSAVPVPDPELASHKRRIILEGDVPSPIDPPSGCRFHPRCYRAQFPKCAEDDPVLTPHHPGQVAACHFPLEDRAVIESTT
jgi:oligopeptide transport system ATP-binding protein